MGQLQSDNYYHFNNVPSNCGGYEWAWFLHIQLHAQILLRAETF
jgi:hypothetical protein